MARHRRAPALVSIDAQHAAADIATLDALARIRLLARRHDLEVSLLNVSAGLRDLAVLAGLDDALFR